MVQTSLWLSATSSLAKPKGAPSGGAPTGWFSAPERRRGAQRQRLGSEGGGARLPGLHARASFAVLPGLGHPQSDAPLRRLSQHYQRRGAAGDHPDEPPAWRLGGDPLGRGEGCQVGRPGVGLLHGVRARGRRCHGNAQLGQPFFAPCGSDCCRCAGALHFREHPGTDGTTWGPGDPPGALSCSTLPPAACLDLCLLHQPACEHLRRVRCCTT
mmetsp:Transcript_3669/g.8611  ORF Transcript_3669/g.8611 Transcript_3669/m.8611 type:complete len:213 (-) Transcript_3669:290-928(-)